MDLERRLEGDLEGHRGAILATPRTGATAGRADAASTAILAATVTHAHVMGGFGRMVMLAETVWDWVGPLKGRKANPACRQQPFDVATLDLRSSSVSVIAGAARRSQRCLAQSRWVFRPAPSNPSSDSLALALLLSSIDIGLDI